MQWVIKHGGLATEESYGRYLAQVTLKIKPSFLSKLFLFIDIELFYASFWQLFTISFIFGVF